MLIWTLFDVVRPETRYSQCDRCCIIGIERPHLSELVFRCGTVASGSPSPWNATGRQWSGGGGNARRNKTNQLTNKLSTKVQVEEKSRKKTRQQKKKHHRETKRERKRRATAATAAERRQQEKERRGVTAAADWSLGGWGAEPQPIKGAERRR